MLRLGIRDLNIYVIILAVAVSAADHFGLLPGLGHLPGGKIPAGQWWHVLFYPFNWSVGHTGWGTILWIYGLWVFGSMLEGYVGSGWFTVILGLSIVSIALGTLLLPVTVPATYLVAALAMGVGLVAPNAEILIFFVLPLKMKWVGLITAVGLFGTGVLGALGTGSALPLLAPAVGTLGFLLFAGVRFFVGAKDHVARERRMARIRPASSTIHRCAVCGLTEADDANMDFRYCVDCADHEYCAKHLRQHTHQQ